MNLQNTVPSGEVSVRIKVAGRMADMVQEQRPSAVTFQRFIIIFIKKSHSQSIYPEWLVSDNQSYLHALKTLWEARKYVPGWSDLLTF